MNAIKAVIDYIWPIELNTRPSYFESGHQFALIGTWAEGHIIGCVMKNDLFMIIILVGFLFNQGKNFFILNATATPQFNGLALCVIMINFFNSVLFNCTEICNEDFNE